MSHDIARAVRVLFVCTGNICRSPAAEAVVRQRAAAAGLGDRLLLDSAGTTGFHVGEPPDPRAIQAAERRGYDLSAIRARQLERRDFAEFDLVLAMASGHLRQMQAICPREHGGKLAMFMAFAADPALHREEVPDPYYGSRKGFETMLDLIERGADGLVAKLAAGEPPA